MPITSEPTGPTKPDAGVMATRPATAPVQMPTTVGLPRRIHSTSIQVKPAPAVANWVTPTDMPGCFPAVTAAPMRHGAAGEVEHLHPAGEVALLVGVGDAEEAVRSPHPMRDRRID